MSRPSNGSLPYKPSGAAACELTGAAGGLDERDLGDWGGLIAELVVVLTKNPQIFLTINLLGLQITSGGSMLGLGIS